MIKGIIHAFWALAAFAGNVTSLALFLRWVRRALEDYFGGLLPAALVGSLLERRVKAGHYSDRRQPDPNFGRWRASDQHGFPPSFPAAA